MHYAAPAPHLHLDATNPSGTQRVYIVGNDPTDLMLLQRLCENVGIPVSVYSCPTHFLSEITHSASGCLIVDFNMPEMSGLDVFETLKKRGIQLATVVLTGFADANACRKGFQAGVFDFLQKDQGPGELLAIVRRALDHSRRIDARRRRRATHWSRIEALTAREMDVAKLLAQGSVLKEIGSQLSISVQTASKHRSSIFAKLAVSNEVELHRAFDVCADLIEQAKA